MTALDRYIRLEAVGTWRETPSATDREVLVSFGNATLVLSDFSDDAPLAHWSLATLSRQGDTIPARYTLDDDSAEDLLVSDPQMIEAIAEVSAMARAQSLGRAQPPRRWGRLATLALLLALFAAGAVFGPDALRGRAYALVPADRKDLLSEDIRQTLPAACAQPQGRVALGLLAGSRRVDVMPWDRPLVSRLPDGTVLLSQTLVGSGASPDTVLGWIETGAALDDDASPLFRWIETLPMADVLRFLVSGRISQDNVRAIAGIVQTPGDTGRMMNAVATARGHLLRRGRPDAEFARDVAARTVALPLDPGVAIPDAPALMDDQTWVALTQICGP